MTRRGFLGLAPGLALMPSLAPAQDKPALHPEFPSQDANLVRDIVGASHANLDRVRELLKRSPELAKASWDWGFGDWETALGAASHVGRHDIAELLIEHGARPDIFTFVMMGHLEAVKALVAARPGIQKLPGPHGITMLAHARSGGERAKPVFDYLNSLGDANPIAQGQPMSDADMERYIGQYTYGPGKDEALEVSRSNQGLLSIKRTNRSARNLLKVEEHGFAPTGTPSVRIRFKVESGRAVALTVHDPVPIVTAVRA